VSCIEAEIYVDAMLDLAHSDYLQLLCIWLTAYQPFGQLIVNKHSAVESISLLTTFICGVYFAKRFTLERKACTLIVAAMQVGLLLSRYVNSPELGYDQKAVEGYWVGMYFNRNSLAPVAMISVVSALALLYLRGVPQQRPTSFEYINCAYWWHIVDAVRVRDCSCEHTQIHPSED
jgi:hypothetical protein